MWVLTQWDALTTSEGVLIYATTDEPVFLYAIYTLTKPVRNPVYTIQRGLEIFCGWKYHLFNSTSLPQSESGPTTFHTFWIGSLPCDQLIYFVISQAPSSVPKVSAAGLFTYNTGPCDMPVITARIRRTTNLTVPTGTFTPVPYDTVDYDTNSIADLGSFPTRLTAPVNGIYLVGGSYEWALHDSPNTILRLRQNGSPALAESGIFVDNASLNNVANAVAYLEAGDYIECVAYQLSGGNVLITAVVPEFPLFWMHLLSPITLP